jgi:hypothetical protein
MFIRCFTEFLQQGVRLGYPIMSQHFFDNPFGFTQTNIIYSRRNHRQLPEDIIQNKLNSAESYHKQRNFDLTPITNTYYTPD